MATTANLVTEIQGAAYGMSQQGRPPEDTLNGAITNVATSLTPTTTTMWKRGDYAEFQPDGELVIFAADSAGATTVRRAQRGTTGAAQDDGDTMFKNPSVPIYRIEKYIEEVIEHGLWPEVWTWERGSFSFTAGDTTYNLDTYVEEVAMVYQYNLNSDGHFYPLARNRWDVERQINTAVSTNLNLLRVASVFDESATVYFTAKRRPKFADIANLDSRLDDIIVWGVLAKLSAAGMITERFDPPRGDRDTREGGKARDYRTYAGEFLRMKNNLRKDLDQEVRVERVFRRQRARW